MENVEHTPRSEVDDTFAAGRACAICGQSTLAVVHNPELPDYVNCSNCGAAFVLSVSADTAMYGTIPEDFPRTKAFALKKWLTLDAVDLQARTERNSEGRVSEASLESAPDPAPGEESSARARDATPPFGFGVSSDNGPDAALSASTPPFGLGELDEFEQTQSVNVQEEPEPVAVETAIVAEPEPNLRFVVTIAGADAVFPHELCAHCLRQPAPRKQIAEGSLGTFPIPLCDDCHRRTTQRSDEQRSARTIAHLGSVLIAAALVVGALVSGLVSLDDFGLVDALVLATLTIAGYAIPALLLLGRASRQPPHPDAVFVGTTMRFGAAPEAGGVLFGFRNRGYAERFAAANQEHLLGGLQRMEENSAQ